MPKRTRAPDHPILKDAWRHEVVGVHYDGLADEPYLDLVLRHADSKMLRRLRFFSPQQVRISGFPNMTWGLAISDVSSRGMEGIGVEVYDFESSGPSAAELYARDVVEVPA